MAEDFNYEFDLEEEKTVGVFREISSMQKNEEKIVEPESQIEPEPVPFTGPEQNGYTTAEYVGGYQQYVPEPQYATEPQSVTGPQYVSMEPVADPTRKHKKPKLNVIDYIFIGVLVISIPLMFVVVGFFTAIIAVIVLIANYYLKIIKERDNFHE